MGSIAPITDLTYDSASLQTLAAGTGFLHIDLTRGINESPSVRGEDDIVSSRAGRVAYSRLADVLPLEGHGWILVNTGIDYEASIAAYRQEVSALRNVLASGKLDPKVLAATLEDGSAATINARVVDYQLDERVPSLAAEIRIAWESVDPDWVITPAGS